MHNVLDAFRVLKRLYKHPMAENNRIKVISRFFYWQLVKRYYKNGLEKKWFEDRKLLVYPGRAASTGNYYLGLLEYVEMSFLLHYARENDLFVDCGANIGSYSVLLGKICIQGYAVEPSTVTCEILDKNLMLNHLSNVKIIKKGVSDKVGYLYFTKDLDSVNHIVEGDNVEPQNCECIDVDTLDSICGDDKHSINILKIDVEGHEEKVLLGAAELLKSPNLNVVIMEVFENKKLENLMRENGFELYSYDPKMRKILPSILSKEEDNGIFIRDLNLAEARVRESKRIDVYGRKL